VKRTALASVILVSLIAVVYRHAPGAYFFEDDFQWLASRANFHPSQLLNLDLFDHFYRPVVELYFWTGVELFDGSPVVLHTSMVLLHMCNAIILMLLARRISGLDRYAFLAALFFAVLPGYVEAIVWVGALAEAVGAFFGMLAILAWLEFRRVGGAWRAALSAALYTGALLTHESSVVFIAIIGLADLAFGTAWTDMKTPGRWRHLVGDYLPFVLLTTAYLWIDITINTRSYLVDEGHYRLGWHAVPNILSYIASLYVGERTLPFYILTSIVLILLLVRGSARVRFATAWMLIAILPFAFFMWGNTSRYQYLPAIGFALLLADGIEWLDRALARRVSVRARAAVITVVAAVITVRFMVFASEAVENFARRTEMWRGFAVTIRAEYPQVPPGGDVIIPRALAEKHGFLYLEALVRWEYRDPTIRVALR
jgi:hypothetical protein